MSMVQVKNSVSRQASDRTARAGGPRLREITLEEQRIDHGIAEGLEDIRRAQRWSIASVAAARTGFQTELLRNDVTERYMSQCDTR
jgi:hypothetical protein